MSAPGRMGCLLAQGNVVVVKFDLMGKCGDGNTSVPVDENKLAAQVLGLVDDRAVTAAWQVALDGAQKVTSVAADSGMGMIQHGGFLLVSLWMPESSRGYIFPPQ